MASKWMRYTALALALLWAGWWVFFETAEAVGSHDFMQAIIFAVVMFGAVAIAWRWPAVGGALLVLVSAVAIAMFAPIWLHRFDLWPTVGLFATMPLPLLVAGVLLLLARHEHHPVGAHPA
jgi:hypothetical protein